MRIMKRVMAFSFVTLGITSILAQVVLLRELMIIFYGNEFFIGWTLFSWLLWVGCAAGAASRWLSQSARPQRQLIICHVLAAALLPAELFLVRASRLFTSATPGEVPDLLPALLGSLLALAPICLVLGAQFVLGARAWKEAGRTSSTGGILGSSYFYETLGFVIGGTLFGYWLITANAFRALSIAAWCNVLAGAMVYVHPHNRRFGYRLALITVSSLTAVVFFAAPRMNAKTVPLRFPGQDVVVSRNSIHGNIAVTRILDQFNFYENGLLLASDDDRMLNEYFIHIPLLMHPAPRRILLLGGGFSGALAEILKHQPEHVDYVELDPDLIATVEPYLAGPAREALADPRVQIVHADGRFFVKQQRASGAAPYDVVIVNLPNPSTALINRFYTQEFFQELRGILCDDGIVASRLDFSPDYLSPELENLAASVYRTLQSVYGHISLLPEYTLTFIASPGRALDCDPAPLLDRLHGRNVQTAFLTDAYVKYRLTTDRIPQVTTQLDANRTAMMNRDLHPAACFYNFIWWTSALHAATARGLDAIGRHTRAGLILLLAVWAAAWWKHRARGPAGTVPHAMAAASFTLMACEIILIFAFQSYYGYLYYKISLLISGLMLGMAMGTWAGTHLMERTSPRMLVGMHIAWTAFCAVLAGGAAWLAHCHIQPSPKLEFVFVLLAAAAGALAGFEFPAANHVLLSGAESDERHLGQVYGADLLGSCLGALLTAMWLLPVLGLYETLLALVAVNGLTIAGLLGTATTRDR